MVNTMLVGILLNVVSNVASHYTIKILERIPEHIRISNFKEFETKKAPIKILIRLKISLPFNTASLIVNNRESYEKLAGLLETVVKSLLYKIVKKVSRFLVNEKTTSIKFGLNIVEEDIIEDLRYFEVPIELYFILEKKEEALYLWKLLKSIVAIIDHIEKEYSIFKIQEEIFCEIQCSRKKIKDFVKIFDIPEVKYSFSKESLLGGARCELELYNFIELLALEHFL